MRNCNYCVTTAAAQRTPVLRKSADVGMASVSRCILCRAVLKKKNRCKITNYEEVRQVIIEELQPSSGAEAIVSGTFLCRTCLRNIEKLIKLRKEVQKCEEELRRQINVVAAQFGLTRDTTEATTTSTTTTPRAGRRGREEPTTRSPATKRRRYDTPVRRQLQQMVPTELSPAVSVSCLYRPSYSPYASPYECLLYVYTCKGFGQRTRKSQSSSDFKVVWVENHR